MKKSSLSLSLTLIIMAIAACLSLSSCGDDATSSDTDIESSAAEESTQELTYFENTDILTPDCVLENIEHVETNDDGTVFSYGYYDDKAQRDDGIRAYVDYLTSIGCTSTSHVVGYTVTTKYGKMEVIAGTLNGKSCITVFAHSEE